MYYPYLRGKQFELKALREIAQEDPSNAFLCPIIDPVKSSFNTLNIAIREIKDGNMKFALVLNPMEGDFVTDAVDVLEHVQADLDGANWIPALIYKRNCRQLETMIDRNDLDDVCVIFKEGVDFEQDSELKAFLGNNRITKVVAANADVRVSMSQLREMDKAIIRLDEKFHEQRRNVDYITTPEEQFTEEPFYYSQDHFAGFSDYTTLSKNFVEGGMLPYAIAIHFTYKANQDMIYIRHFVSDTNLDQSNIQGKFSEAGSKAVAFFSEHPKYFRSSAIQELVNYIKNTKYPGLGVLKKLSIKHHLQLVSHILENL